MAIRRPSGLAARREKAPLVPLEIPGPKREVRHLRENEKIYDLYYWEHILQEDGDGGKVVVCREKEPNDTPSNKSRSTRFDLVMKIKSKALLQKNRCEERYRSAQLRLLNLPPHDGIMPLREVLEDKSFYYVVMQKARGGGLLGGLLREFGDGVMPVRAVRGLMREILEAVGHLHRRGVLHRDIKPDNVVLQVCDDPGSPKGRRWQAMLIDFDHADPEWSSIAPPRQRDEVFGTLRFNAPETFLGCYSQESDLYSVGMVLYLLMTGNMPHHDELFEGDLQGATGLKRSELVAIHDSLKQATIDWQCNPWPEQPACCDLCQRLLAFEPGARPSSAEEALVHEFFNSL